MVDDNLSDQNKQGVMFSEAAGPMHPDKTKNICKVLFSSSLVILLALVALLAAFLKGICAPLYLTAIISLIALPFVLIGWGVFCGVQCRWVPLIMGIVVLPPAWVVTFLAFISDYPPQPPHRLFHGVLLISGAFACWLFLMIAFRQGPPGSTAGKDKTEHGSSGSKFK